MRENSPRDAVEIAPTDRVNGAMLAPGYTVPREGLGLRRGEDVPDVTADLFDSLRRRGQEPLLRQGHGTLRFELEGGQPGRWTVAVDRGNVTVSHASRKADCTVRTSKEVFDGMARGEVNAMAAFLRGAVTVDGDPELFVLFQRIFPTQPRP